MLGKADFGLYFANSLIVTVVSLFLVLLLGAMAAWALTEYRFRGNTLLALYLAIGIMVPIRLGSVSILKMMVDLGLVNTLAALDPRLHGDGPAARDLHPQRVHPADAARPPRRGALRRRQRVPHLLRASSCR